MRRIDSPLVKPSFGSFLGERGLGILHLCDEEEERERENKINRPQIPYRSFQRKCEHWILQKIKKNENVTSDRVGVFSLWASAIDGRKAIYCNSQSGQRCDLAKQNGEREKECVGV